MIKVRVVYLLYGVLIVILFNLFVFFFSVGKDDNISEANLYSYASKRTVVNYKLKEETKKDTSTTIGIDGTTSSDSSSNSSADNLNLVDGDSAKSIWEIIKKWSSHYGLDPVFVADICAQETDFGRLNDTSSAGAKGIMQNMPSDVQELKQQGLWESDMTTNFKSDDNSVHVATRYLKYGYDRFVVPAGLKDDVGALAAGYNGWWATTTKQSPPYLHSSSENKNYYFQVKARYEAYISGAKKIGEK